MNNDKTEIIFLREIKGEEIEDFRKLVEESIEKLPFTFAFPISRLFKSIEKGEYGRAMNYALDFFEISVLWLSAYLLRIIIEGSENLKENERARLDEIIKTIDNKRPMSFGDSINSIMLPLLGISHTVAENPLTKSIQQNLMIKNRCILLGDKREPNIVHIRNEYRGHSTTLSENIYRGVIYTLEPRILAMLKALSPLLEAMPYTIENGCKITHNGLHPVKTTVANTEGTDSGHYLLEFAGTTIDLYPLVLGKNEVVYVFHTLKGESVSYISANENAVNITTSDYNDDYDRLFQKVAPWFDIAKQLNFEELRSLSHKESAGYLKRIYQEKRYNKELFVERKALSSQLSRFIASNSTQLFPILGEAGQGKTNQLCYWVETMMEHGKNVLIFQSSDFASISIEDKFKEIYGLKSRNFNKILADIHKELENKDEFLYIFFDAINECLVYNGIEGEPGPLALLRDIGEKFLGRQYPRFKIVITCRNYTWKTLLKTECEKYREITFEGSEGEPADLKGFTSGELKEAYSLYRELYQMSTSFDDVTPSAKIRLKDPLVLKLCCTNYLGAELPLSMDSYTSLAIFEKLITDISNSYAGKKQIEILEDIGLYILTRYENGDPTDSIPEEKLAKKAADDPILSALSKKVFNRDGMTIAYGELINKPERPVLRIAHSSRTGERLIQFIYERFLEFIIARIFITREIARAKDPAKPLPAEVFVSHIGVALNNEVYMSALRNVMAIDILRTHDYSTMVHLIENFYSVGGIPELISEVCNTMVKENYETDMFNLMRLLLRKESDEDIKLIVKFNETLNKIENNTADGSTIEDYKKLTSQLESVMRLKKIASLNILNGIFATDYFNENLYTQDPYNLLWLLLEDSVREIKNDTCMYVYYLSKRKYTIMGTPVEDDITQRIVDRMIVKIKSSSLLKSLSQAGRRKQFIELAETTIRLIVILIIDNTLNPNIKDKDERNLRLLNNIREIFNYVTFKGTVIRLIMPLFKVVLRKQITFQSAYVNNAIEYQGFWNNDVVPLKSEGASVWDREQMSMIIPFISYNTGTEEYRTRLRGLLPDLQKAILSAYRTGDSFSYFVTERILVILGIREWNTVYELISRMLSDEYAETEWFDYSQMSLLYSLLQISQFTKDIEAKKQILELYEKNAESWTRRCKGLFKARYSHKANPTGLYKRNVLSWYAAVYFSLVPDGEALEGDLYPVPLYRRLIDEAIDKKDNTMLLHILENISETITDGGFITTGLQLLELIMQKLDSAEAIAPFETETSSVVSVIGSILTTAKNYYPEKVDRFIKHDIEGLSFPGISRYRSELLDYNPASETLSDLLTHKFGNYLMWSLINEETFTNFAVRVVKASVKERDCFAWFDHSMRLMFSEVFNVKFRNL